MRTQVTEEQRIEAAEELREIAQQISDLVDQAMEVYRSAGGFEARARAYWHAHIKDAIEGERSASMMDAADELQRIGSYKDEFDDEEE